MPSRSRTSRPVRRRVTRARRRIRLDTDARRAQLLALGKAAFADRSYDEVSIDDIAKAAQISKGLLYHYFPTKRDLYVAGLRETSGALVEKLSKMSDLPKDMSPQARIHAGLDAYLDHVGEHAHAFVALMRGGIGSDPEVAQVIEGTRTQLAEQIFANADDTPIAMLAHDPLFRIAVRGWIGFVEATSIEWLARPTTSREALRDLLTEVLLATLEVTMKAKASAAKK